MPKEKTAKMTKELFEEKIKPTTDKLFALCEEHGLDLILSVVFEKDEETMQGMFSCYAPNKEPCTRHRLIRRLLSSD